MPEKVVYEVCFVREIGDPVVVVVEAEDANVAIVKAKDKAAIIGVKKVLVRPFRGA